MGPVVIVGPQPIVGKFLNFVQACKQMMGKPIVANGPVVTLDVSILLWVAGLDEIDPDPCRAVQAKITALMYSGPLSHRAEFGLPRHSMIRSALG